MHGDDIALITGISGQDGLILAKKLLSRDVKVYGTTRQKNSDTLARLSSQGILNQVQLYELDLLNRTSVEEFLSRIKPTSIYNFGSMSSVGTSIQNPVGARISIEFPTNYILNWIKNFNPETIFFNPCSSEMFGDTKLDANENTPFAPKSPYALAKTVSFKLGEQFRNHDNLKVINAILFNHESHLRRNNFFSKKVISTACQIVNGENVQLEVGNIAGIRDWGWAPDHVDAMLGLVQQQKFDNYVISTREGNSLEKFIEVVFGRLGLDWRDHTSISPLQFREADIIRSVGDYSKIKEDIGWTPTKNFESLIDSLIQQEMKFPVRK
jgi:GDPmannose 4,6-dehydratase